ncbi:hypothetical protein Taro_009129 [Colocasia esculenta]|uniref:BHLH domain-containing protein n=1 Tax=Colocasia esculenta TaxID=4460 RepID=A0A843TZG5_COLES|nr:hypothetical protein [Colocasia esculenta]
MSQEGGGPDNMLWEAHAWAFSNSDNSGGCDDKPLEKTPPESGSNSPADVTAAVGTKRTRNGPKKAKNGGHGGQKDKGIAGAGGESDHEIHIWTERERRKKMRNMFANLHALLPHLPAKADKSTIVDEAVNYIRTLQLTLQKLQKQKLERLRGAILEEPLLPVTAQQTHVPAAETSSREAFMADRGKNWAAITPSLAISVPLFAQSFQTWTSPNVVLSMTGNDAHINICAMKKPGLLSSVLYVLERHKLEVVSAHVSSDYFRSMFMIHAHVSLKNSYKLSKPIGQKKNLALLCRSPLFIDLV